MEVAVLAAFTALLSMQKRSAASATVAWSPVTGLIALGAFIAAVLFWWCARFHAVLVGSLIIPTVFMAICVADVILMIVLWRRWSRFAAPAGAIAAAFITVLVIAAIAWWQVQKFQLIALGRA